MSSLYLENKLIDMKILGLSVHPASVFHPMYYRPYSIYGDTPNLKKLVEHAAGMRDTTAPAIYEMHPSLISPYVTAHHCGHLVKLEKMAGKPIPYMAGHGVQRGRFVLGVEVKHNFGATSEFTFQGYTDRWEISPHGTMDPNTVFYINSYTRNSWNQLKDRDGNFRTDNIVTESVQLLDGRSISFPPYREMYGMRPIDLLGLIQTQEIVEQVFKGEESVKDTRNVLTKRIVLNNRRNNSPMAYLSAMLDAYSTASSIKQPEQDGSDMYNMARGYLYEGMPMENPFLRVLSSIVGEPDVNKFTLRDLLQIDSAMKTTNLTIVDSKESAINHTESSEPWHRSKDDNAWAAFTIANALPSVVIPKGLARFKFVVDNKANPTVFNFQPTYMGRGPHLVDDPSPSTITDICSKISNEILRPLSKNLCVSMALSVEYDAYGDTIIEIDYDNLGMSRFAFPSFCDSITSPVIALDTITVNNNVTHLKPVLMDLPPVPQGEEE